MKDPQDAGAGDSVDARVGATQPLRRLGVLDAALMVVGSVVGAGIFFTSGVVAAHVKSPTVFLALWLCGGVVALVGALCNGELGSLFPRGGGEYVYLREAYGPPFGFLSGWTSFWIGFPGSIATLAYGFAQALATLFGVSARAEIAGLGVASIAALTALNARGIGPSKWLQNGLSGGKLVVFTVLVGVALVMQPKQPVQGLVELGGNESVRELGVALLPILFTYSGWNVATYVAGEIENPRRNVGVALLIGTAACVALYLVVNIAYLRVLPFAELRGLPDPARATLERIASPRASSLLTLLIALSILSSLQATVVAGPRIFQAMAEDDLFFPALRRLHPRTRVPARALWAQAGIACLLLASGSFEQLLTFTTFAIVLFSTLTVAGVVVLRFRAPKAPRRFAVPAGPVLPCLFVAVHVWVLWAVVGSGALEALIGIAIVAAGVPVYLWFARRRKAPMRSSESS